MQILHLLLSGAAADISSFILKASCHLLNVTKCSYWSAIKQSLQNIRKLGQKWTRIHSMDREFKVSLQEESTTSWVVWETQKHLTEKSLANGVETQELQNTEGEGEFMACPPERSGLPSNNGCGIYLSLATMCVWHVSFQASLEKLSHWPLGHYGSQVGSWSEARTFAYLVVEMKGIKNPSWTSEQPFMHPPLAVVPIMTTTGGLTIQTK